MIPALIVLVVGLYVVSLIGVGVSLPAHTNPRHLSNAVIGWATIGLFDAVLIFPAGIAAMMRLH